MTEIMDLNTDFSDDDEDIIELTDILEDLPDSGGTDDGVSAADAAVRDGAAAVGPGVPDDDAIEAALLRIVEKKYARRLDTLFVEAVERVVEREIAAIKQSLLKDL